MNLTEELDQSFGDGPAHRPVEQTLVAGRRLVVRRRLATGASATVAAVVIGGAAFALAGGGSPSAVPETTFATAPTSSPEAADLPVDAGGRDHDLEWGREAAYLDTEGNLRIKPGWTIAEQMDEPLGPGSVAVEVAHGGKRQWFLWDGEGGEVIALGRAAEDGAPDPDYASFAGWVADISNAAPQPNDAGRR
jgi:hypothetical protein